MYMDNALTLYVFKLVILFNAYSMGWEIRKINNNSYELKKKIGTQKSFNLEQFINHLTEYPINIDNLITPN